MFRALFTDFDGVLRRLTSSSSQLERHCLDNFESAVRPLPNVKIVISSTWRLVMSLKELRRPFSSDVAKMIVGMTPELPAHSTYVRHTEIRDYLKKNNMDNESWVAIGDDPKLYPKDAPLLLIEPNEGFNDGCATRLWEYAAKEYL